MIGKQYLSRPQNFGANRRKPVFLYYIVENSWIIFAELCTSNQLQAKACYRNSIVYSGLP